MVIGRKAIFYVLMSFVIVGIIAVNMLVFSSRFRIAESSSIEVVKGEFTNTVVEEIRTSGLDRFSEAAAAKALYTISTYIGRGENVDYPKEAFNELVRSGTYYGDVEYSSPTLLSYLGTTTNTFFVLGFKITDVSVNSSLYQEDPWSVNAEMNISYLISVPESGFSGIITETKNVKIPIYGMYADDGLIIKPEEWSAATDHPGFLEIIYGDDSPSEYGICKGC